MRQMVLFPDNLLKRGKVVNVASVPQRSPFRYPGGKTWLVPQIRQWLLCRKNRPAAFVEPFAGGGIASLTAAFEKLAEHVIMVELDKDVAAVWKTILGRNGKWLARKISSFGLTIKSAKETLSQKPSSLREMAFQTILKNRVLHGGILAPGSGLIKYGENGKGIRSRWYPETLKRRILNVVNIRDRFTFIRGDGIQVIREKERDADAVFFIDPPYTAGGKKAGVRLYTHFNVDHEKLFRRTNCVRGDFLMTYDDSEEIRDLARRYKFQVKAIPMKNTHHARMYELLISRNLDWL